MAENGWGGERMTGARKYETEKKANAFSVVNSFPRASVSRSRRHPWSPSIFSAAL